MVAFGARGGYTSAETERILPFQVRWVQGKSTTVQELASGRFALAEHIVQLAALHEELAARVPGRGGVRYVVQCCQESWTRRLDR